MNEIRKSILVIMLCVMAVSVVMAAWPTPALACGPTPILPTQECANISCPKCTATKIQVKCTPGIMYLDTCTGIEFCKTSGYSYTCQGCGSSCPK